MIMMEVLFSDAERDEYASLILLKNSENQRLSNVLGVDESKKERESRRVNKQSFLEELTAIERANSELRSRKVVSF
jgi:hypothetical protein